MIHKIQVKGKIAHPSPAILTELFSIILLIKEQTLSPSPLPKDGLDEPIPSIRGGKEKVKGS